MLDQNTDRMWYVIGAIVIGAAIIAMGLNIFDSSFESVDSLMVQQMDIAGRTLDEFEIMSRNLLIDSDFEGLDYHGWREYEGFTITPEGGRITSEIGKPTVIQNRKVLPAGKYKLRMWYELKEGQTPYFYNLSNTDVIMVEGYDVDDSVDGHKGRAAIDPDATYGEYHIELAEGGLIPAVRYAAHNPPEHLAGDFLVKRMTLERYVE